MRAHVEDDRIRLVAFAQHLARGEDLATQVLPVVGHAELTGDQISGEEGKQVLAQPQHVLGPVRRHDEGVGPVCKQALPDRGFAVRIPDPIHLVEDDQARNGAGTDVTLSCRSNARLVGMNYRATRSFVFWGRSLVGSSAIFSSPNDIAHNIR